MRYYRRLLGASVLFLGLMAGVGMLVALAVHWGGLRREIYPFSTWFLFSRVQDGRNRYQVALLRIQSRTVEPGLLYNQAEGLVADPHSIVTWSIIQQLGRACESNDGVAILRQRRLLEAHLPSHAEYAVLRLDGDLLEEWRTRSPEVTRQVGTFQSGVDR